MKISELLDLIKNKSDKNISQSMLSKALNVTRQNINNRIRNNSEITLSELRKIEDYFGLNLISTDNTNNIVKIDYFSDVFASCGNGLLVFSEDKEVVDFHKSLIHNYNESKKYSMINAKGDSMSPYINNGDRLIVEHSTDNQIIDNKVYVFCYKSDIFVKRLSKNFDEIIIKSDNTDYGLKVISGDDMNDIRIIGKIVGIVRDI